MLFSCAAAWGLFAALQLPLIATRLTSAEQLSPESLAELSRARLVSGGLCLLFLAAGTLAARASQVFVRGALFAVFGVSPLVMVELGWAPYFEQRSPIFVEDETLGWRLRPDTRASWLGVPVEINSRGMRGPLPRTPQDRPRALFLGDSVVFGFRLEDEADALPAQLEARLKAGPAGPVEVLNAGVGGWSP